MAEHVVHASPLAGTRFRTTQRMHPAFVAGREQSGNLHGLQQDIVEQVRHGLSAVPAAGQTRSSSGARHKATPSWHAHNRGSGRSSHPGQVFSSQRSPRLVGPVLDHSCLRCRLSQRPPGLGRALGAPQASPPSGCSWRETAPQAGGSGHEAAVLRLVGRQTRAPLAANRRKASQAKAGGG